jgi:hypothetical protein
MEIGAIGGTEERTAQLQSEEETMKVQATQEENMEIAADDNKADLLKSLGIGRNVDRVI